MLKRYATIVSLCHALLDVVIIAGVWIGAYFFRFSAWGSMVAPGGPAWGRHLMLTVPVVIICFAGCSYTGLYRAKRIKSLPVLCGEILKASVLCGLCLLAFFYYLQEVPYSRKLLAVFGLMLFVGLVGSHVLVMVALRHLRTQAFNARYYAVVGTGTAALQLVQDIEQMGWMGLHCAFLVDDDTHDLGTSWRGIPVYRSLSRLPDWVVSHPIDEIYVVLDRSPAPAVYALLRQLQTEGITVRMVPDWGPLASVGGTTVVTIGGQVLFSAAASPLDGFNGLLKGCFDRLAAAVLLLLLALPMALIALVIRCTSPGPVLYRQTRMGLDQREFEMLKFRTMVVNADQTSEVPWTRPHDERRTAVGGWLRRMSLDELPQLFNVLCGQMSLVGPRPERPALARRFSEQYSRYMLRHTVKSGMTGWAQIHGLRGNTSLRKRLLYDLYYIRNWSLGLDLWILLLTPWHLLKGDNAY